jgi:hypothetical protein
VSVLHVDFDTAAQVIETLKRRFGIDLSALDAAQLATRIGALLDATCSRAKGMSDK